MHPARCRTPVSEGCALEHAEQITRIVWISEHVELYEELRPTDFVVHLAQGTAVLDREAHAVEQRNLFGVPASFRLAAHHLPQLGCGVVRR